MIRNVKSKVDQRISLTNIKVPRFSKKYEPEKCEPWSYDAYEYMRKNFIGKTVNVKIDEIKKIKVKEEEMQVTNASITFEGKPIAIGLLENGFGSFKQPKMNDASSEYVQAYAEAQEKAISKHLGIHSNKQSPVPNFMDLTQQNKKKIKGEFMLKGYDGIERGVVLHCFNAVKYKILFHKAKVFFNFQVNSLRGLGREFENEKQEKVFGQGVSFAKQNLLQRDV